MTEVLVSGCFNILHSGHCKLLEFAAEFGKVTVGINADPYLKKKYGDHAVPLCNRVICLKSNKYVEKVVAFPEQDPSKLIRLLRPRYYIKGPDYRGQNLSEESACHEVGTQIIIHAAGKIQNASELVLGLPKSALIPLDFLD